jgi:hypothetical protein
MAALSTNSCQPIIGTVTSVHSDPRAFGTDVVLNDVVPAPSAQPVTHDGMVLAFIPADNAKAFSALETYLGQQVAVWGRVLGGLGSQPRSLQITKAGQLQLLSIALADPKKTWCFSARVRNE